MSESDRRRSFWHWGFEEDFPDAAAREAIAAQASFLIPSLGALRADALPRFEDAKVRAPRIQSTSTNHERVMHAGGKGYRDVLRAFRGEFPFVPDVVLTPESDEEIAAAYELAKTHGAALVPFGGGTSVVSGVSYDGARPIVSVDLRKMRRVVDVDSKSRLVRIQGGATGPDLESQLAEHDASLTHVGVVRRL